MNEEIQKKVRKYKCFVILSILGLIFSVSFIVYFFIQNDNRFYGFGAILLADLYELQRDVRRYREARAELDVRRSADV